MPASDFPSEQEKREILLKYKKLFPVLQYPYKSTIRIRKEKQEMLLRFLGS